MSYNAKEFIHFPIEGELTRLSTGKLREAIFPIIASNDEIEIDLSRVTEVDEAGMQLLVSVKFEATLRDKTLRYAGYSKPVLDMIDLFDLGRFFDGQIVID